MRLIKGPRISITLILILAIIGAFAIWKSLSMEDDSVLSGKHKLKLQLQWFDQSQFAGFYVAEAMNYYSEENLDVQIIAGGFNVNPIGRVLQGESDVGLATADQILLSRANGQHLKAIGSVFNTSLACFMSKTDSGILTPQDLLGRVVGVYRGFDTENILLSMLLKHQIAPSEVDIREAGSIEAFRSGEIEVWPSYLSNEPISMREKNISVNVMRPSDFGIQFYSDTMFTTFSFWENNQDILEGFLKASAKGWEYTEKNPNDALDIMYRSGRIDQDGTTRIHQEKQLREVLQYLRGGNKNQMFYMERSVWESMEDSLVGIGKLKTENYIENLCDFEMIERSL